MKYCTNCRKSSRSDRGVAIIMTVLVLSALAFVAVAFMLAVHWENMAATNSGHAAQAELAARSGLAHAIAVINSCYKNEDLGTMVCTPDGAWVNTGTQWEWYDGIDDASSPSSEADYGPHRYFELGAGEDDPVLSDSTRWVSHYQDQDYSCLGGDDFSSLHLMKGRVWPFSGGTAGIERGTARAEYAVCVVDLDGKLPMNPNPARWGAEANADLAELTEVWAQSGDMNWLVNGGLNLTSDEISNIVGTDTTPAYYSIDEIAVRCLTEPNWSDDDEVRDHFDKSYALEAYLTTYPRPEDNPPAKPQININTARLPAIEAVLSQVPSGSATDSDTFGAAAVALAHPLAQYIVACRPYRNRLELEEAVYRVVGSADIAPLENLAGATPNYLTEVQFNNLLQCFAGVNSSDESVFDDDTAGNEGQYSLDGWAEGNPAWQGPSQTGGSCCPDNVVPAAATTWGTEVKFRSRFYHIYCLGRAISPSTSEVLATSRVHAVFDADDDRIVWFRINLTDRGNLGHIR